MGGGIIGAAGYSEVLVTTYSGRIFGLTTKPPGLLEADQNDGLMKLRTEIQELQEKLNEEKEIPNFSVDPLAPLILSVNHRYENEKIGLYFFYGFFVFISHRNK